jgi:hypothetical protein
VTTDQDEAGMPSPTIILHTQHLSTFKSDETVQTSAAPLRVNFTDTEVNVLLANKCTDINAVPISELVSQGRLDRQMNAMYVTVPPSPPPAARNSPSTRPLVARQHANRVSYVTALTVGDAKEPASF